MKKAYLLLTMIFGMALISCTPESQVNVNHEEFQTDPNKNCPPNDTNCNGIPDDQED